MSTAEIMHCRHCEKYIGKKNNLDDYFFWCDKTCHDANEKEILDRNLATMAAHEAHFKNKKAAAACSGNVDKDSGEASSSKEKQKAPRNTKKK